MALRLNIPDFKGGAPIPKKYTCDGQDVSPALEWDGAPAGAAGFAIIVDDPDAPVGTWVHWVIYGLPAHARKLSEGVSKEPELPSGERQGKNDFGKIGYNGPCPPKGRPHRYFFKLYALDRKLSLKSGATKAELERAMKNHVLAETEVIGRFQH